MQEGLRGYAFNTVDKDTFEALRDKLKGNLTLREDQIRIDKDKKLLIIFTGLRALSNPDMESVDHRILRMVADKLGGRVEKFSRSLASEDEFCLAIKVPESDLAEYCAKIIIAMNAAFHHAKLFDTTKIVVNLKVEAGERAFMDIFNKSTENPKSVSMGEQTQIEAK